MTISQVFAAMIGALSEGAAVAVADDSNFLESLFPEERVVVRRAVEKRQREFAAGRHCARRALAQLGVAPGPIAVDASRAPQWPPGFVGSITHCAGFTAAVVAPEDELRGIGVDAEPSTPLATDLRPRVLTPAEVAWLQDASAPIHGDWAKTVFSAKESVHKCIHPLTTLMLDFLDVQLTIDPSNESFRVHANSPKPDAVRVREIEGRFAVTSEFIFTGAVIRANTD